MFTRRPPQSSAPALAIHHILSRNSLVVAAALLLLTLLAWAWLWLAPGAFMADTASMDMGVMNMAAMDMAVDPWSATYLSMAFAMWSIMMVAMMLPSAAPMILLHARIDRAEPEGVRLVHSILFITAYLFVWTGFSVLAAGGQAMLLDAGLLSTAVLAVGNHMLTAALLLLAAGYELTPVKRRCLENCQSPLIFIHRHWTPGAAGAFRLGIRHGLYCMGCCWALMLLLFAGGVMNLAWVAIIAILAAGEKFAPPEWHLHRWVAALLFLAALLVILL